MEFNELFLAHLRLILNTIYKKKEGRIMSGEWMDDSR